MTESSRVPTNPSRFLLCSAAPGSRAYCVIMTNLSQGLTSSLQGQPIPHVMRPTEGTAPSESCFAMCSESAWLVLLPLYNDSSLSTNLLYYNAALLPLLPMFIHCNATVVICKGQC
mmetsp:Transcript_15797/g.19031  ORF Transcript_15797/g.19031 Transcript_15797/m.19031 type:complete len:116 (+) Transcript_15797:1310-1657(+)